MTLFIEHITREGERWDQIADRYYGDPFGYEPIITANPYVPIVPILDAGTLLLVPVLEEPVVLEADLPPWKL